MSKVRLPANMRSSLTMYRQKADKTWSPVPRAGTTLPVMSDARPQLSRCKRPLGIQNLREIREGGYCTADKSGMAVGLVESGKHSFLSRPHRFGKSLLVDTLKELFEGHRALFSRLAAESRWDWLRRHPGLRFSFSGCVAGGARVTLGLPHDDLSGNLANPIRQAHLGRGRAQHRRLRGREIGRAHV